MPKPPGLSIQLTHPGSLRREVIGYKISEPKPDVNPDVSVVPFLQRVAGQLAPEWAVSDERFDETSEWSRGEFGGEDVLDGQVRVGTARQHVHIRYHYREPEQEMFPTERREFRWYTAHGLPARRHLGVHVDRTWIAGRLICADLSLALSAPARLTAGIEEDFRATFEKSAKKRADK